MHTIAVILALILIVCAAGLWAVSWLIWTFWSWLAVCLGLKSPPPPPPEPLPQLRLRFAGLALSYHRLALQLLDARAALDNRLYQQERYQERAKTLRDKGKLVRALEVAEEAAEASHSVVKLRSDISSLRGCLWDLKKELAPLIQSIDAAIGPEDVTERREFEQSLARLDFDWQTWLLEEESIRSEAREILKTGEPGH